MVARFHFVPDNWILTDELRSWTKSKGLSDQTIDNEIESFMDHQYKRAMSRPDSCWRNWVKNGIRWGTIETVSTAQYRRPDELTDEQRAIDIRKTESDFKRLRSVK